MSHFALVEKGIVKKVIEATALHILGLTDSENWVQTSIDTKSGVHAKGNIPIRKNYAGIGMAYNSVRDAFYHPRPVMSSYFLADGTLVKETTMDSWVINETTCQWEPPTPKPDDGKGYDWDEKTLSWIDEFDHFSDRAEYDAKSVT